MYREAVEHERESSDDVLSDLFDSSQWATDLAQLHPELTDGLRHFTQLAVRDGALPGSVKLLFMAATAAATQQAHLAEVLLTRALRRGLAVDQASGAASVVTLSRGMSAGAVFLDALRRAAGPVKASTAESTGAVDPGEAIAYLVSVYGEVPFRSRLMRDQFPGALEAVHGMRSAALRSTGLAPKHTELLLVSLNSALHEPGFAEAHARDARDEGASDAELAEAVAAAIPLGGMAAWSAGATAIESALAKGSRRGGK